MYNNCSILALVPARGGSKGLPGKNVLNCAGKPLIEWTITAALNSIEIDEVLVSTDDEVIASIARRAGASVPFLRPKDLSTDDSSMLGVIQHAWQNYMNSKGERFDCIILLQPTSPLRTSNHISEAIKCYFANYMSDTDTLASVYSVGSKYGWLMQPTDDGKYIRFSMQTNLLNPQRQNFKNFYLPNGAIFIMKGGTFSNGLYRDNTIPFIMEPADSIDIDNYAEFKAAEGLLKDRIYNETHE